MVFDRSLVLTGSPEDYFAGATAVALVALGGLFLKRAQTHSREIYDSRFAWLRAGMFFCGCFLLSWGTGVMHTVTRGVPFTDAQASDPAWLGLTGLCAAIVIHGYIFLWPRGTFTLDRPLHLPTVLPFGLLWGLSIGQLFCSVWALVELAGLSTLWTGLGTWLVLSGWQGAFHAQYWDIHVSPEHNIEEWNKWKVMFAHIPNLSFSVLHLALFGNPALFIAFHTVSLASSAFFMHFPTPWLTDDPENYKMVSTMPPPKDVSLRQAA